MSRHHPQRLEDRFLVRREFLQRCGVGMGGLMLGPMLDSGLGSGIAKGGEQVGISPLAPHPSPFVPRTKRVIHLFMNGGPSQVDTFDPKPELTRMHGKTLPMKLKTERKTGTAFKSPYSFKKYGESGLEVSELFPNVAKCADDLCVIRSMHANVPNHEPSLLLMNCGDAILPRPSMGSWLSYGLGTENQNLPAFVSMCPGYPIQESQNWQSGFLPGIFQGTYIDTRKKSVEEMIAHIRHEHILDTDQRAQLDLLQRMNRRHLAKRHKDAKLEARIESFELAYRMQMEATDAFDVDREPEHIRTMYGEGTQARQILIARRLVERGVRFVQCWHGHQQPWDNHDDLEVNHRRLAKQCDQAIGALLTDLKQRGLLDETLVIWGGEFGRTPVVEMPTAGANAGKKNGRDHNHHGFTMWMAGGGVKPGVYGATDEFGFRAEVDRMHVHDLHATILHLLGFDHEAFTYRYAGRDFRLTDVHGNVVHDIVA